MSRVILSISNSKTTENYREKCVADSESAGESPVEVFGKNRLEWFYAAQKLVVYSENRSSTRSAQSDIEFALRIGLPVVRRILSGTTKNSKN